MPKLLLNLRNVPDDEAGEVRALLEERKIAFYETKPSLWGVSGGAIWIKHPEDAEKAQRLMAEYQIQRRTMARAEYDTAKREGTAKTLSTSFRDNPLRVIGVLIGIAFLVAVMALPFLLLSD
jgi:hypothetical protein